MNSPCYSIHIDISKCAYAVRINDVPMIEDPLGRPLTVEMPVNPHLLSGANVLSVTLKPAGDEAAFAEDARAEVQLKGRPKGAPKREAAVATQIVFSGAEADKPSCIAGSSAEGRFDSEQRFAAAPEGDVAVAAVRLKRDPIGRSVHVSREVRLTLPFPPWIWLGSQQISADENTRLALEAEYKGFWDALSERDDAEAVRMCGRKMREIGTAFYLSEEEAQSYLQIEAMLQDDSIELFPWKPEGLKLEVFGGRRLARLVTRKGQSPIVFVAKDRSAGFYIELMYCRTANGWVICR